LPRQVLCERCQCVAVHIRRQTGKILLRPADVGINRGQGFTHDAVSQYEPKQSLLLVEIISKNHGPQFLPAFGPCMLEQQQKWQCQLAFLHICPQRLPGLAFLAENVHAVVVNLVRNPQIGPVLIHRFDNSRRRTVQNGSQLATDRKKGPRLHIDDFQVLIEGQIHVKTPLGLNNLAGTDGICGFAHSPADFGGRVTSRQSQGVSKQAIPK